MHTHFLTILFIGIAIVSLMILQGTTILSSLDFNAIFSQSVLRHDVPVGVNGFTMAKWIRPSPACTVVKH